MTATANRYQVEYVQFTGSFAPGDQIVIDMKRFKATLNGSNALHLIQGDFFNLTPGDNDLVYTDSAGSRQVLIRISNRARFI